MQARYYDPVIGRFYSNDPISYRGVHSFNRYNYAANNPYKYVDPDGKDYEASYISLKIPFLGSIDVGNVSFTPNSAGQGESTSGVFVRVGTSASNVDPDSASGKLLQKSPIKSGAIGGLTLGIEAGSATNQTFDEPDASIVGGVGPVAVSIGSLTSDGEASAAIELGLSVGLDATVSKSFSLTSSDIINAVNKTIDVISEKLQ